MSGAIDSAWARRKLDRARRLLDELEGASEAWLWPIDHPLDLRIAEDGSKIEATLAFATPPPLGDWSLIVGDCVHNIRTALDVFVWANSSELADDGRKKVAYPILPLVDEEIEDDEELPHRLENQSASVRKWVSLKVAGLPESLRSRVIGNMRWASLRHEGRLLWHQVLPLIRELDDIDKHRLALQLDASWSTAHWDVRAADDDGRRIEVRLEWAPDAVTTAIELGSAVVATGVSTKRIAEVRGGATLQLGLRVSVCDRSLQIPNFLVDAIDAVEGLIDVLSESD